MLKDWKNFKNDKPKFTYQDEDMKCSNQCFFLIDNKICIGCYVCEQIMYPIEGLEDSWQKEWIQSIETARYTLDVVHDLYQIKGKDFCEGSIYADHFDEHEIYWHNIDLLGIMCSVDLLKKEEENGRTEIAGEIDREGTENV